MPLMEYWPVVAVAVAGAVGYGELRSRSLSCSAAIDTKSSKEAVEANYREIIRRLDRIEDRIDRRKGDGRIGDTI